VSRQIDGPEASVELASEVHLYRFVFSPNGEWVAFTTHARNAYVAPADGSSPPVLIGDDVNAVAVPQWAPDSTWVAFYRFFGGYDRCLGVLPPSP
jgi:Tol biopolymer transport system component